MINGSEKACDFESVEKVLELDKKCRYTGINDDIFPISSLERKDWNFSLPTILKEASLFSSKKDIKSNNANSIASSFFEKHLWMKDIDWNNMIVAGGSISQIVLGIVLGNSGKTDIDIFFYGIDKEQAEKKIKNLCEVYINHKRLIKYQDYLERRKNSRYQLGVMKKFCKEDFPERELRITYVKTKNTFTIDGEYQVIFRLYSTISEILHGFDLGSSAIGFDGKDVWLTSLGMFSYTYLCNILDTTRRSTSYESRIIKYFKRGFDVILPLFDIDSITNELWDNWKKCDVCKLPKMHFSYYRKEGNKIFISDFFERRYASAHDYDIADFEDCKHGIFYTNIRNLVNSDYDRIMCGGKEYEKVLKGTGIFTREKIREFYENLIYEIHQKPTFPTSTVNTYVTVASPEDMFSFRNNLEKLCDFIRHMQLPLIQKHFDQIPKSIKWISKNPGTQISGSFNPIIEEPKIWYGPYFLE